MNRGMFGWDLPPGVSVSDIPGNRPEDVEWEKIIEDFLDEERIKNRKYGILVTEKEIKLMDSLYASKKWSGCVDAYIQMAIEYGMELGRKTITGDD